MSDPTLITITAAARDDLRCAATLSVRQPSDLGTTLAHLSATVTAMDSLLIRMSDHLTRPQFTQHLGCVDGPFEGDLSDAIDTARLWLESANVICGNLRKCLDNANVAVGGLAETPQASS